MDMTEILIKAWEVSDELKTTPEYMHFREAEALLHTVPTCKLLLTKYETAKTAFQETSQYGTSHPSYGSVKETLISTRTALFERVEYQNYLETKRRLDDLLNSVTEAINDLIRPLNLNQAHACKKGPLHGKT